MEKDIFGNVTGWLCDKYGNIWFVPTKEKPTSTFRELFKFQQKVWKATK